MLSHYCKEKRQFKHMLSHYFGESFPVNCAHLERQLREVVARRFPESAAKELFFGGPKTPSFADFNVFHHVDNAETVYKACGLRFRGKEGGGEEQEELLLALECPLLHDWAKRMRGLPKLAEYLQKRPTVIGVGEDPGLKDLEGFVVRQREGDGHLWLRDGLFGDEP